MRLLPSHNHHSSHHHHKDQFHPHDDDHYPDNNHHCPPDCVQLSVEQYRAKLYDIIRFSSKHLQLSQHIRTTAIIISDMAKIIIWWKTFAQGWEGAESARKDRQRWKTINIIIIMLSEHCWHQSHWFFSGEKGGERRASSHELRAAKEGGGRSEPKEKELVGI